jgi:hypothetical protein
VFYDDLTARVYYRCIRRDAIAPPLPLLTPMRIFHLDIREARHWYPWRLVATLLVLPLIMGLVACGGTTAPVSAAGRIMVIEVAPLVMLNEAGHSEKGMFYAIRPTGRDMQIVAAHVHLHNPNATLVSMLVDEQASYLEDTQGNRFWPLNPWEQRVQVANTISADQTTMPLLWGELTLERGFKIEGWMLFEVPTNADVTTFTWDQVDFIRLLLGQGNPKGGRGG